MHYVALALDYDGTIATDGRVDELTVTALRRVKESGRKLILVTGRELPDLKRAFSELRLFDCVIAENGALMVLPETGEEKMLAPPPDESFVERLKQFKVAPLSVGRSIVATWHPNETKVLEAMRELGLELQITFNKGAVMVLASGINKESGLRAALDELDISPLNVIGVGEAEYDEAFLRSCGQAVAVANALPAVKKIADAVTEAPRGAGVAELVERLLASEDETFPHMAEKRRISIGKDLGGNEVALYMRGGAVLIACTSGSGKSTFATALLEQIAAAYLQFCVFDPEGDYPEIQGAIVAGDSKTPPSQAQILDLLRKPATNVAVNMLALPIADRPPFFAELLAKIAHLRATLGHPHWLLVDEAHHMLPRDHEALPLTLPQELPPMMFVTVHPHALSPELHPLIDTIIGIGKNASDFVLKFCQVVDEEAPPEMPGDPAEGQALYWSRKVKAPPRLFGVKLPKQARKRHTRKYAEGELGEDKSFYFRGPAGRLNLRTESQYLSSDCGRSRRRNLVAPFGRRRLLALVPRSDQG
jgi:HAD superfamily hydrolase (TIGR01484 family)